MAEYDKDKQAKDYYTDIPNQHPRIFSEGSSLSGLGDENRLSRIFRPDTGNGHARY